MSRLDRLSRARARLLERQAKRGLSRGEQAELDAIETAIAMDGERTRILSCRAGQLRLGEVTP